MKCLRGFLICAFMCFSLFSKIESSQISYPTFEISMLRGGAVKDGYIPLKKAYDQMDPKLVKYFQENYEKNISLPDVEAKDRIPRIIHQIWLGGKVPEKYREWMEGWASLKGWTYKLWTDENVGSLFLYNRDLYELSKNKGEKSDMLRLELLDQFGGLYVDVDYECINKDIFEEAHRKYDFYIGFEPLEHGIIVTKDRFNMSKMCNALIAASPRHPLIKHLIVNMKANYLAYYPITGALERSGPSYLTRVICEYVLHCPDKGRNMFMPCTFFYPFTEKDLMSGEDLRCVPEMAGIHYWSGSWRTKNWKNIEEPSYELDQNNKSQLAYMKDGYLEYMSNGYVSELTEDELEYLPEGYADFAFFQKENLEYLSNGYAEVGND